MLLTGIAQSQTAQPFGTFANNGASDPQLGALPGEHGLFHRPDVRARAQVNGPGMFYTTTGAVTPFGSTFTNLDPTLITNITFNVEVGNAAGISTNYFAVQVGRLVVVRGARQPIAR